MDIIDLGSPEPRRPVIPFKEFDYPFSKTQYLPVPKDNNKADLFETLVSRSTNREFAPTESEEISTLLWYSSKISETKDLGTGHIWQHRPTPSAGGRHPIDLMILSRNNNYEAGIYDPRAHAIAHLDTHETTPLKEFSCFLDENFKAQGATIIWFVAQPQKTTSAYNNATSLIYRDVGALEATIGLVAEGLNLNHCSIGISGEPWISSFLNSSGMAIGVGGILIGKSKNK